MPTERTHRTAGSLEGRGTGGGGLVAAINHGRGHEKWHESVMGWLKNQGPAAAVCFKTWELSCSC